MILNKYSEVKQGNNLVIGSYSAKKSTSSSSSSSSSNKSVGLDREIWGQDDDGGDLNGDLTCEGNIYIVDNWDDNEDDEDEDTEEYIGARRKEIPIMPLSIADDLVSKFDNDEGGNMYVKRQLVVDKDTYSKTIYLDYPTVKYEDDSNKTNLLDLFTKYDDAKFWGRGLKANNYNIVGTLNYVDNINFSGDTKLIGAMSSGIQRPNGMYSNGNIVVSSYNGNPWETSTNMKNVKAMSYLSESSLTLNSVNDYNNNGHYYNNPRIVWWVFNPTTLAREGHWWLGPTWANDYDKSEAGDHLTMSLYPSFEVPDDMKNEDDNPKAEYFEQYTFNVGSKLRAYQFIKYGGTNQQFLMADGSTKVLSDLGVATASDLTTLKKAKSVILATVNVTRPSTSIISFSSSASCYDGLSLTNTRVGEGCIDWVFSVDTSKISNLNNLYANATIGRTQENSDTDTEILNGTSSSKSFDGAYGGMWNHTRAVLSSDKRTLVVRARVFHKDKDDNESVDSNKDYTINAIMNMSLIVCGEPTLL